MNIKDIPIQPFFCSQSCTKCALGCERKWFFKYRWGLGLKGVEIKESAELGKVYHKYQEFGPGQEQRVKNWIRERQQCLAIKIDKGEDIDGAMSRLITALTVASDKAEAMARLFWEKYPAPSYLKTIGTEIKHRAEVTINIGGKPITIPLEGTIDKLILDERSGDVWERDHKSTGRSIHLLFEGFPWSVQARIYRILGIDYLMQKGIKGNVKGFILDGIAKPGIKLCGKDNTNAKKWDCTPDQAYLRRVKEWYNDKEEKAKSEGKCPPIFSQSIFFNEPVMPIELARDLAKVYRLSTLGPDPLNYSRDESRTHCSSYEKSCIYMSLCMSPISQWPKLLDDKYKIKPIKVEEENEDTETDG